MTDLNFALYYAADAYTTEKKIMGRQSAGKALLNGVVRRRPTGQIHGFGAGRASGEALARQVRTMGFRGTVRWREAPGDAVLDGLGAVYYPAPQTRELAHARNSRSPSAYSLIGVTHTLSSAGAMDGVADLALPPFQPWDALICTSRAAQTVASRLQAELRDWFAEHTGATRFNTPALPVIPLGCEAPAFLRAGADIDQARTALKLTADEVAFLFAGRLTFHAKANPAEIYLALEAAAAMTDRRLVCIEAGVAPNARTAAAYVEAQTRLAPSVRFIPVDGADEGLYRQAWRAADVFVSMSDNIQETFGLTPLEAMAAGLPVLVSDWNGYKDTVRHEIDGYRIPVTLAPAGAGADLALRHALGQDTYDFYIGRVSMATSVDTAALTERIVALAGSPDLRRRLGQAGQARARSEYDWPVILDRYVALAAELGEMRRAAGTPAPMTWRSRPDPFELFSHYPTRTLGMDWAVTADADRQTAAREMLTLGVARYALDARLLPPEAILALHQAAARGGHTVRTLLEACGGVSDVRLRALMWLDKLDLVRLHP